MNALGQVSLYHLTIPYIKLIYIIASKGKYSLLSKQLI